LFEVDPKSTRVVGWTARPVMPRPTGPIGVPVPVAGSITKRSEPSATLDAPYRIAAPAGAAPSAIAAAPAAAIQWDPVGRDMAVPPPSLFDTRRQLHEADRRHD
jgi:hypothetical protein